MTGASIEELIAALRDLNVSKLLSGVATTLAVYDTVLMFADEVETIYQSKLTPAKMLFYYVRIVTPPGLIFGAFHLSDLRPALSTALYAVFLSCKAWAPITTLLMLSSLVAANGLFALRLVALYRRNKYLVWFIHCFFAASYLATLGLLLSSLVTYHDSIFYSDKLRVCASLAKSATMPAIFYAPAAFEAFVFALTAFRAWKDAQILAGPSSAPFLLILYRDGLIAFFVMFAFRIWNIWIYLSLPLSSFNLGTPLMWAINTILSTRTYMNLVYLAKNPVIVASTQKEFVPAPATLARRGSGFLRVGGNRTGQGIPMQVHTFTEIHIDDEEVSNSQYMPKRKGNLMDEGGYQSRRIETRTLDTKRISIYDGSDGYTTHSKSPA
ncbi:hypothetical protein FRC17_003517 [Serendipita sp. 399]|nr:hypothetical protein FRC17_003517 [Serendipita sp. 399]